MKIRKGMKTTEDKVKRKRRGGKSRKQRENRQMNKKKRLEEPFGEKQKVRARQSKRRAVKEIERTVWRKEKVHEGKAKGAKNN